MNLDFVTSKIRMKKIPVRKGVLEWTAGFCGECFVGYFMEFFYILTILCHVQSASLGREDQKQAETNGIPGFCEGDCELVQCDVL